jgi:hypothetical protein
MLCVEVRSSGTQASWVSGLQITHNQFVVGDADPSGRAGVWMNESAGPFHSVNQTSVAHNVHPPATYGTWKGLSLRSAATEATRTAVVGGDGGAALRFGFGDGLLLDCARFGIAAAQHSLLLPAGSAGFPRSALRLAGPCAVQVDADAPLPQGTRVSVSVQQLVD